MRFRIAVLTRAGWQCQAVDEHGQRCPIKSDLQAHHLTLFREDPNYDPARAIALCRKHHAQVSAAERAA